MTDNISTSPATSVPKASNVQASPAPLVNAVVGTNDTSMLEVGEGTLESGGING
jgi:hypothetical protein